ncbi:RagB/SusD family nutrient uptake outer membrane protein [Dyadobacter diqingensis]|uniref:RagB/SusD family nutrient uptake outer membrane protein n=1 Tax=Dyadobacter diqingensis TaxID=2938121 RepID=UPI0020C1AF8A|nr:RagB/SusD family nutrient uptake outer membrane protein [Dyadobacter diqingensis]
MKNIKRYLAISLTILLTSCSENLLDLYPETRLTDGSFYKTEAQFIQATNDVYRQLGRIYDAGGIPDLYGELFSDNVYIEFTSGANAFPEEINKHKILPDNGKLKLAWETAYNGLYITNNVLAQLEKTEVTFSQPALKERLKAEARLVRAVILFNLVQAWGDVPLPLTVVSPTESYQYAREKKETVYQQIITDLSAAKSVLPASYTGTDIGRATRYAASALLAKLYLAQGDKTKAALELKVIIDSGLYSLDANRDGAVDTRDFEYIFKADTKNSKESILEAQYLAGQNQVNSLHQQAYTPFHFAFHLPASTETFRGDGLNTPTPDLIGEFEEKDPRKNLSLYPGYTDLQSNQFIAYPFTLKFFDPQWRYAGQNFEIIRYADILLLYAEATENPAYLNQVRARVGLPGFGQSGYPEKYNTLALALEHERRSELAFEFHRFFDLVRTGRAAAVLTGKGIPVSAGKLLFPIPQSAIDVNPAIIQNP